VEVHPQYGDPAGQLAVAVTLQANAVRVDYTQEYGEAYYDALFAAAAADGLAVMEITPYIHTNGTFAQQLTYTPATYAAYMAAEAAKRCGSVPALIFELYNEPDVANSQALIGTAEGLRGWIWVGTLRLRCWHRMWTGMECIRMGSRTERCGRW
jgi:hypothetical protein